MRALQPRSAPPASPKVYLADLFGGTGGVARHATQLGLQGRVWDVCLSPHLDITLPRCRHVLVQDAHAGLLQAVMLAPECRSWSNARARTNAIRSKTEPWGVAFPSKPLTANDIAALKSGNKQVRAVISLLRVFDRLKIPWALENPRSSYLWATPEFLQMANYPWIETRRIDQCAFGTAWKKSTLLMFSRCEVECLRILDSKVCCASGVCHYTKKPHIQLIGNMPGSGRPWTAHAQTYPPGLAHCLATILVSSAQSES